MSRDPADKSHVPGMFATIAGRYDLLNDLLTAGRHRAWKRAAASAAAPEGARVLDLGSGTGDIARELVRLGARHVVAADLVKAMLRIAQRRAAASRDPRLGARIDYVVADALQLPFPDATFDAVSSGFLVRNVPHVPRALAEMARVLRPGGRLVCLEASRREGRLGGVLRAGFSLQSRLLGRVVARAPDAYAYLPDSAAAFHTPDELAALLTAAGFTEVGYRRFGLGLVALHWGRKPAATA